MSVLIPASKTTGGAYKGLRLEAVTEWRRKTTFSFFLKTSQISQLNIKMNYH